MAKYKCPRCGCEEFYTTIYGSQIWRVYGNLGLRYSVSDIEIDNFSSEMLCANCYYVDNMTEFEYDAEEDNNG